MLIKKLSTKENAHAIEAILETHSNEACYPIPDHEPQPISLAAYEGDIYLGGITGDIVWNHLHIHLLAVDTHLHKKGVGSALIAEAERLAREADCRLIIVETMSWQKKGRQKAFC